MRKPVVFRPGAHERPSRNGLIPYFRFSIVFSAKKHRGMIYFTLLFPERDTLKEALLRRGRKLPGPSSTQDEGRFPNGRQQNAQAQEERRWSWN